MRSAPAHSREIFQERKKMNQQTITLPTPDETVREPDLISLADAARMIGVAVCTLYCWRSQGRIDIPDYKRNGILGYDRADVLAWIRSCRRDPHKAMQ
jgi:predicted DNA-binding transcriptional regulator AlpA